MRFRRSRFRRMRRRGYFARRRRSLRRRIGFRI